jgi:hypothetical protein
MRPAADFRKLQFSAFKHLARLRGLTDLSVMQLTTKGISTREQLIARQTLAICTIELFNVWTNFARSYFLSCILRPRRVRRGRITHGNTAVVTFEDAVRAATKRHKPSKVPTVGPVHRRDEPHWHDAHVFITSCAELKCSHEPDIAAAFSVGTRVLIDLPVVRNFFAHRNAATASAAQAVAVSYAIPSRPHPIDILTLPPAGRPFPLLIEWIDDVHVLVELLCE